MAIGESSYLVIIESLSVAVVGRGRCRRRGDIDVEKSQIASAAKIVGPIVVDNTISPIKIQQMVRRRRRNGPKTTTATVLQPAMGHSLFCGVYVYEIVWYYVNSTFPLINLTEKTKQSKRRRKNQSESIPVWIEERGVPRIEQRDAEMFCMAFFSGIRNGEKSGY